MLDHENCAGPCATACKPGAGTGKASTVFESIIVAATEHAAREAGLPGRADRMIACRSCGAPTASSDGICRDCADAMREFRAAALDERRRVHGVRYVDDLPVSVLEVFESIMVSARTNAPANDDLLHGRVRLCRSCGCETTNDRICGACADAMREERAATLREQCRIHRVRYVEDLPVSVLEEMQVERGRS